MRQRSQSPLHQWTILHAALTRLILSQTSLPPSAAGKGWLNMYIWDIKRTHPCVIFALKMPGNLRGHLSLFLVREVLTFKFPHLLHYGTVDTLNSLAGERSRIDHTQALDDRCLTFWNIDRNVMMPFKIGHVAHY